MTKDPVCGIQVEEGKAAAKSTYQGKTYYFCSAACSAVFEEDQGRYAPGESGESDTQN